MKSLKLKCSTAYVTYSSLKKTPPKDFPDVEEMTITVDEILPAFESQVKGFIAFRKEVDEISVKILKKELTNEEGQAKFDELNDRIRKYEATAGAAEVTVELENAAHDKFVVQFERWGKNWFNDLETYVVVRKALNEKTK